MKKGCGFILLCVIGLIGISLLYYALLPFYDTQAIEKAEKSYVQGTITDIFTIEADFDTTMLKVIPVLEYDHQGTHYTDSAYHLARHEAKLGYVREIGYFHYKPGTQLTLELDPESPKEYKIKEELPIDLALHRLALELQTGFIIVGSILMLIFLLGLSRRFKYQAPQGRRNRF